MTVSQEAHHHFLVFFSGAEDNNKPLGSSSSLGFFLKCRRWWQAGRLPARCHLLGFFSNVSSLATSPPDASLYLLVRGDVTTPFLSHHTLTTICRTVAQNPHFTQSCKYSENLGYNFILYQRNSMLLLQFWICLFWVGRSMTRYKSIHMFSQVLGCLLSYSIGNPKCK
jgi:hypothetical protein